MDGCCERNAVAIEMLIWMSVYVDVCCLCLLGMVRKQKTECLPFILIIETALDHRQHRFVRKLRKTIRGVNVLPARRRRERRCLP